MSEPIQIDTNGITILDAGRKATWFVPPCFAKDVQLIQVGDQLAHVAVMRDGAYCVGHVAGEDVQWQQLRKGGVPVPTPSGDGWLAKVKGAVAWVWGKAKAVATSKASGYVLVAVLTAGAFLATSQFKGCDIPWPKPSPVVPDDAMTKAIKEAYAKETGDKKNMSRVLAALYRQMADNPFKETTVGQVYQTFMKARKDMMGDALPWTRAAIGTQFDKVLPTDIDAPMTPATQEAIRKEFRLAAAVLETLP